MWCWRWWFCFVNTVTLCWSRAGSWKHRDLFGPQDVWRPRIHGNRIFGCFGQDQWLVPDGWGIWVYYSSLVPDGIFEKNRISGRFTFSEVSRGNSNIQTHIYIYIYVPLQLVLAMGSKDGRTILQWPALESPSYTTWWQQTVFPQLEKCQFCQFGKLLDIFVSIILCHEALCIIVKTLGCLPGLQDAIVETRLDLRGGPYSVEMLVFHGGFLSDILDVVRFLYPKTVHWKLGPYLDPCMQSSSECSLHFLSCYFFEGFTRFPDTFCEGKTANLSSKRSSNCVPEAAMCNMCKTQVESVGMGTVFIHIYSPTPDLCFPFSWCFHTPTIPSLIAMVTKPLIPTDFWKGAWSNPNEFGNVNYFTFGLS